jgi:hypothetical protein
MKGFRFQVSAQPPAKKTAGQIEKETNILLENGIGFHEVSYKVSGTESKMKGTISFIIDDTIQFSISIDRNKFGI